MIIPLLVDALGELLQWFVHLRGSVGVVPHEDDINIARLAGRNVFHHVDMVFIVFDDTLQSSPLVHEFRMGLDSTDTRHQHVVTTMYYGISPRPARCRLFLRPFSTRSSSVVVSSSCASTTFTTLSLNICSSMGHIVALYHPLPPKPRTSCALPDLS